LIFAAAKVRIFWLMA